MHIHTIPTVTHGRYLVDHPRPDAALPLLVGFHGYGERAEDMLDALRRIRADRDWVLVSVQALNRFYTRTQDVVANWMTREDRELAIADNIEYVAVVVREVRQSYRTGDNIVYAGFSQGVAMAYRAAAFVSMRHHDLPAAAGGIMLAGDIPPDVVPHLKTLPPLLIGRGVNDDWYTAQKADADLEHFRAAGMVPRVHVFDGGHTWDESFVQAAGEFLELPSGRVETVATS